MGRKLSTKLKIDVFREENDTDFAASPVQRLFYLFDGETTPKFDVWAVKSTRSIVSAYWHGLFTLAPTLILKWKNPTIKLPLPQACQLDQVHILLACLSQAVSAADCTGQKVGNVDWCHVYDVRVAVGSRRRWKVSVPIVLWTWSESHGDGHGVTIDVTLAVHPGQNQLRRDWVDEFEEYERRTKSKTSQSCFSTRLMLPVRVEGPVYFSF